MDIAPFKTGKEQPDCSIGIETDPTVTLESSVQSLSKEDRWTQTNIFSQSKHEVSVSESKIESFLKRYKLLLIFIR